MGVGHRQGSALLFIVMMNLIRGKIYEQAQLTKLLYAEGLAVVGW